MSHLLFLKHKISWKTDRISYGSKTFVSRTRPKAKKIIENFFLAIPWPWSCAFVDYSIRGTMLLVQMDIHIAVACADGRNRPKNITNWRVGTCDGPGIIYILPEVAVARSYLTFCLTDHWTARANLKILLKLCFAFLLSCWENGPGLLYFHERALTMTSYLFLFEKEWRVVDARL